MDIEKLKNNEHISYCENLINIIKVCDSEINKFIKRCVILKRNYSSVLFNLKILENVKSAYIEYTKTEIIKPVNLSPDLLTINESQILFLRLPKTKHSKDYYNNMTSSILQRLDNDILMRKTMNLYSIYDFED